MLASYSGKKRTYVRMCLDVRLFELVILTKYTNTMPQRTIEKSNFLT
jgi:hypothetical protein